jgi:hypothetical protein
LSVAVRHEKRRDTHSRREARAAEELLGEGTEDRCLQGKTPTLALIAAQRIFIRDSFGHDGNPHMLLGEYGTRERGRTM